LTIKPVSLYKSNPSKELSVFVYNISILVEIVLRVEQS